MARKIISIYFNQENESDLIQFSKGKNFSKWVKQKIKEELGNSPNKMDPVVAEYVNRLIESRIAEIKLVSACVENSLPVVEDDLLRQNVLDCFG